MSHIKYLVLFAVLPIIFQACSSPEQLTTETKASSKYPQWYQESGFESDSLSFNGYATAISSDSMTSIQNAELLANANLESGIAEILEEVRDQLASNGSDMAVSPDFIITLRTAHAEVEQTASQGQLKVKNENGYYRGFVQTSITRDHLISLLKDGFDGKNSFWEALSNSNIFNELIK